MTAKELIELENRYGAHNYHPLDVVLTKGEGVWVYDTDGKKYLDCLSSYSALNQGHCHPRLVKVMQEQATKLTLTSRAFRNDQLGPFCKEICEFTGYEKALPMNSGAEGVETAIKAVRKWGHKVKGIPENKAEIITMSGNFHGRTTTVISFSTENEYKDGFGPFTPGFITVPYGDFEALEKVVNPNTAAILLEPIQGESGIVVPQDGYLRKISELCKKERIIFIADEIQTGLGRTGKLLACDHEGVRPDALILGKALAGGFYPVSVFLASKEVMDVFRPGDHGSTFGGNPLGIALAREAIHIISEENLIENATVQGEYFMKRLRDMNSPHVDIVRGKGLLIGVVLNEKAGGARQFCEALEKRGVLCKETHYNIIRFAPPLVIKKEEIDWAMEQIEAVLK
ncbi:MAG: ornithine--oxo-acid transaminase [Planctomycetes bacterium]|jgi:ornithine--oxo-acid transaminase|nr:ornithine--oxo-acid transaminase [Planctomycetota bacterium]HNZ67267.1 ornithine--oxo-acid transaminase [Planctomycetota bacterium]HPY74637.1 ornithine--oxo-acid transaminase [Planctomycetota bacterium]HQB00367.1 ornithine--oxo-acid transaminase [Planctomycetota bacterium]